jgi:peptide/nickel transport system permease protein
MSAAASRILRDRRARVGIVLVASLALAAVVAPAFVTYSPAEQLGAAYQMQPPSASHLFGTDSVGRDLLSRVLSGIRLSLGIALLSVLISVTIGTGVGLVAGYAGGAVDSLLMRFVDAGLAIPRVLLLLTVLAVLPTGVVGLVCVLGLTSWFGTSRMVRAEVLSLRSRDFILATRALGVGGRRTITRHLLPNAIAPVIVTATLGMGHIILVEAGLSFLGAGVPRPTASLGGMIGDGAGLLTEAWWISTIPGLVIVLIVVGFSLLGDGIRDAIDPRSA